MIVKVPHLSKNQAHHERTKHIDARLHFIREMIENKYVFLSKVTGENNTGDIFTKAVPVAKLQHCLKIIQLGQEDI